MGDAVGAPGVEGSYGPNDRGYMVDRVREAAERLRMATELYSEGHYPHSNARDVPADHPLALALKNLGEFDRENCHYANEEHDEFLFAPYEPPKKNKHRWDAVEGSVGVPAEEA